VRYSLKGKAASALLRSKKSIALAAVVLGAAVLAGVGLADVWSLTVAQDTNNVRMRVQHMTTANFDSGWHYHPGLVVVQVTKGSLAFTQRNCTTKTFAAGDTFIEVPYVPGRVVGVGEANMTVTYILGYGDALAVPVSPSPCP
jgi:hypothetical protein